MFGETDAEGVERIDPIQGTGIISGGLHAKYVDIFFHSFCKHKMRDIHNFCHVHM